METKNKDNLISLFYFGIDSMDKLEFNKFYKELKNVYKKYKKMNDSNFENFRDDFLMLFKGSDISKSKAMIADLFDDHGKVTYDRQQYESFVSIYHLMELYRDTDWLDRAITLLGLT